MRPIAKTWPNLLKHVSLIIGIFLVLTLGFFYIYLPSLTNHGETITVPDLEGMPMDDLDEFLVERNLRYEVSDSSFSSNYPALTVLSQFPKAGSRVKESRKVYLTVNSFNPPTTRMPDLIDRSLRNAQLELNSYELVRGKINFRPSPYENAVLEAKFEGESIEPGTKIPKGSVIDLVVGDGYGNRRFTLPSFVGMPFDEVKISITGMSLRLGSIINQGDSAQASGFIYKQIPEEGQVVKVGEAIDLWVTPTDSLLNILLEEYNLEEEESGEGKGIDII
jgi:beta-lactam-binding protein with PASTA domain